MCWLLLYLALDSCGFVLQGLGMQQSPLRLKIRHRHRNAASHTCEECAPSGTGRGMPKPLPYTPHSGLYSCISSVAPCPSDKLLSWAAATVPLRPVSTERVCRSERDGFTQLRLWRLHTPSSWTR